MTKDKEKDAEADVEVEAFDDGLTEDGNANGAVHDLACVNAFVVGTVIVEGSGDPQ